MVQGENNQQYEHSFEVGFTLAGPAVLEQPDATTIIDPGLQARVGRFGNVIVERD